MDTSPTFKIMRNTCLALVLLLSTLINPHNADAGRIVRVGVYEAKPLAYSDKDGSAHGFFVDMLNHIANKEQWNVQYVPGIWQEGLDRLKSDNIDLVLCIGYTAEREKYMDYPKEYLLLNWGVLYRPKGSQITSLLELEGKSVSALKGDVYLTGFLELARQFNVHVKIDEVDKYSKVFKAVESGAVAAGVAGNLYGILNDDGRRAEQTPVIFSPIKVGYAVNDGKNGDLIAALDRHIAEMKADKTSIYYRELEHLLGKKDSKIPKEAYWALSGVVAALLIAIIWNVMLKRQVKAKTENLVEEIAERKQADKELRESKAKFQAFYDLGLVGLTITSPEKGWLNINDRLCKMLGYTEAELRKMTWDQLTHPDDLAADVEQFERVLSGEIDGYELDKRFLSRSGEILFTKLVVRCTRKQDLSVEFIVAMVEDITERKQIENELLDAEWKFRALFDNGPIGVAYHSMIYDESGEPVDYFFIDANDNYLNLTGVDPRGKTVKQAFPGIENDSFDWIGTFGNVAKTGKSIHFEQYLQTNNRWYDVVGYQYKPDHFVASFVEITDRKNAENSLKESEFRWKFALEGAGNGVWDWNIQTGEAYYSPRYKEMLGFLEDEIGNTSDEWSKRIHPDDAPGVFAALTPYLEGKPGAATVEFRMLCKDGSWKPILGRGMVVSSDVDGKPLRMIGTNTDLSERKKAEQERNSMELQMQHAQKLESLGVLAGGIAHDFNNILMAIIGNADLALMRINKESPATENLHKIEQAAARAADLAKQMLAYSGKGKFVVEHIDLNNLLEDMLHMLEVSISKKAILRFNLHQQLPTVEADATQIRQIVMNLVINASEAIGDKSGVIAITTGCMDCEKSYLKDVWLDENLTDGLYVYLEIADTGHGMNKETLAKIFDPFFTTKFTGRGLGMAAVLGIVRGHKGAIKVYSELNKGTTFKILLPASGKPAEIFNHTDLDDNWKGVGTVLLVDDEETVRGIGAEMLRELGFEAITAEDGRKALEQFKSNLDIALVILDLTMPHMDGEQCFRELRQINPDVKVIMSSGFNEQEITQKFVGKGLAGFIQKPYKLSVLKEAIRRIQ